jgi:osmotically-inducible protein OsmY
MINRFRDFIMPMLLLAGLGLGGCTTIVTELAQKAWEDRTTEDQATDTKIAAGVLNRLADRDKGLILDVSTDVWEQRVLLTGTLDNAKERAAVEALVRKDKRIKRLYRHIKIVSKKAKQARREQAEKKDSEKKGGVGQTVNDFWIEIKIKGQLVLAKNVTSVNYRWRSVFNDLYVIGRAGSVVERDKVLGIIRETEGVKSVRHYIQIKPVKKNK